MVIAAGSEITGFGDVKLYVLNPPEGGNFSDLNDNSVVIKLRYEKFGAIFTGDISSEAMEQIGAYDNLLKSDVLKMPHHGGSLGKKMVTDKFFRQISAQVSVTSSGGRYNSRLKKNRFSGSSAENYNTKINGAITILTKGDGFKIGAFCQKN